MSIFIKLTIPNSPRWKGFLIRRFIKTKSLLTYILVDFNSSTVNSQKPMVKNP